MTPFEFCAHLRLQIVAKPKRTREGRYLVGSYIFIYLSAVSWPVVVAGRCGTRMQFPNTPKSQLAVLGMCAAWARRGVLAPAGDRSGYALSCHARGEENISVFFFPFIPLSASYS